MKTPVMRASAPIMPRHARFVFSALVFFALTAVTAPGATDGTTAKDKNGKLAAPAANGIVELPELKVYANREIPPPEQGWMYARFKNFEILTEIGEKKTRDFIYYFGQYVNVISALMPQTEIRTNIPAKIILCDKVSTFSKFGDAFRSRALSFFNNEQVVFVANLSVETLLAYDDKNAANDTGDLMQGQEEIFIMPDTSAMSAEGAGVDWSDTNLASSGAAFGANITDPDGVNISGDPLLAAAGNSEADPLGDLIKAVQREYMKIFFSKMNPKPPAWFIGAMSRMFMGINMGGKDVSINNLGGTMQSLAKGGLVPLAQVFGNEPVDPKFNGGHVSNTAFAFMHYCLYRNRSKLQPAFAKFLFASGNGPAGETVFKECFGMGFKRMELELLNYAEYADYKEQWLKFDKVPAPETITVRTATEPEVGRIKGEAFLVSQKTSLAQGELITPYFRKNTDSELLGALGLVLLGTENSDRARKILELAFKDGTKRTRVCVAVAEARLASALEAAGKKTETEGKSPASAKLDPDQLKSVLEPISVALSQTPPVPDTYAVMAQMWEASSIAPRQEHLRILSDGCRLFPANLDLAATTAKLQIAGGFISDAAIVVRRAYAAAQTPEDKAVFQILAGKIHEAASAQAASPATPSS